MSKYPSRIAIAQHEDVRSGTWMRWWWPYKKGATNPFAGREFIRGDIADDMLAALKAVAADARERDRQAGDPVLNQVQIAIAKAEGKT